MLNQNRYNKISQSNKIRGINKHCLIIINISVSIPLMKKRQMNRLYLKTASRVEVMAQILKKKTQNLYFLK